jgi:hypothetical protein
MTRLFIITSIAIALFSRLSAQDVPADSLLFYEKQFYLRGEQEALLDKLCLYLRNNVTGEPALREVNRVRHTLIRQNKARADFLWNASLLSYINNENARAEYFIDEYLFQTADSSIHSLLLASLIKTNQQNVLPGQLMRKLNERDTVFRRLTCLKSSRGYRREHIKRFMAASAIIPGSGMMANGNILRGTVALALSAGSALAVVKMIQAGAYLNGILWGAGVGFKFYAGNIRLTQKLFREKESKRKEKLESKCAQELRELLLRYPLSLRY